MNKDGLRKQYLEWMYQLVRDEERNGSYYKLFEYLFNTNFTWLLALDKNRAEDGTDLRYRFGLVSPEGYPEPMISMYLDDRACSVLEMMVALAVRCEEHIMSDPTIGDRTGYWFWGMIDNLGLGFMDDRRFDVDYVKRAIHRLLLREYDRDGRGGLFTLKHYRRDDLREVEIWDQLGWYLSEILYERRVQ